MSLPNIDEKLKSFLFSWMFYAVLNLAGVVVVLLLAATIGSIRSFAGQLADFVNWSAEMTFADQPTVLLAILFAPVAVLVFDFATSIFFYTTLSSYQAANNEARKVAEQKVRSDNSKIDDLMARADIFDPLENVQRSEYRGTDILLSKQVAVFLASAMPWLATMLFLSEYTAKADLRFGVLIFIMFFSKLAMTAVSFTLNFLRRRIRLGTFSRDLPTLRLATAQIPIWSIGDTK